MLIYTQFKQHLKSLIFTTKVMIKKRTASALPKITIKSNLAAKIKSKENQCYDSRYSISSYWELLKN